MTVHDGSSGDAARGAWLPLSLAASLSGAVMGGFLVWLVMGA